MEYNQPIERTAKKKYRCDNCACTIHPNHRYIDELIYVKSSYDDEFEIIYPGHSKHWRTHLSATECDLAMRIEIGNFLTNPN